MKDPTSLDVAPATGTVQHGVPAVHATQLQASLFLRLNDIAWLKGSWLVCTLPAKSLQTDGRWITDSDC